MTRAFEGAESPITAMDDFRPESCRSDHWVRLFHHRDGHISARLCTPNHGYRDSVYPYVNVTRHPTAKWTMQQFRGRRDRWRGYKFIIHDRDNIYSREVDSSLEYVGIGSLANTVPMYACVLRAPDP